MACMSRANLFQWRRCICLIFLLTVEMTPTSIRGWKIFSYSGTFFGEYPVRVNRCLLRAPYTNFFIHFSAKNVHFYTIF